jgi:anti-sigma factor RsiW
MTMVDPILDSDLDAYVDDQLPPRRRLQVQAHLARHPDAAARVMGDLHMRGQLRLALQATIDPAGAPETREAARRLERGLRVPRFGQQLQRVAAVGLVMALGWAASTSFGPFRVTEVVASEPPPVHVEEAVRAHRTAEIRETMSSQPEVKTYDPEDIRAATAIVMPTLPDGWSVIDVQVFPSRFGPSVELAIRTPDTGRMSLFAVRPGAFSVRPVKTYAIDRTQAADWQIGDVAYALVSDTGQTNLSEMAERLSRTLY